MNSSAFEVLNEDLKGDILSEDSLSACGVLGVMGDCGVEDAKEVSGVTAILCAFNIARVREAVCEDWLCVRYGLCEEVFEGSAFWALCEAFFARLDDVVAEEDEDEEERVEEEYMLRGNRSCREEHRRWLCALYAVHIERRLNHSDCVGDVLAIEAVAVENRLIRRVVERLHKLRPPQVEHKLREQSKAFRKPKR